MIKTLIKYAFMLFLFCIFPIWGLLPFIVAIVIIDLFDALIGIVLGIIFGIWFYGNDIMLLPLKIDYFDDNY